MPLLLPNLDDRTWADLVAEGTSLIPVYGPEWTDQNYSDPGITIVELLAAITEMDIYQLNQISENARRKFLALLGVKPRPPHPAHAVISLTLASGIGPITLPASLEFEGLNPSGFTERYRTLRSLTVAPGTLKALRFQDSSGYLDPTPLSQRRAVMSPFGSRPEPGAAFYLGFSAALPVGQPVQCFFIFADGHSTFADRERLLCELAENKKRCQPTADNPCQKSTTSQPAPSAGTPPPLAPKHYGVRTVWEYQANVGGPWIALDPAKEEVVDDTRSFTLDGSVVFRLPAAMASDGGANAPYYVRCRFDAGRYDAAPLLQDVAFNGTVVEQAVPASMSFAIDPNATIVYSPQGPPKPNDLTSISLQLDEQKRIVNVTFGGGAPTDPQFRILEFRTPTAPVPGKLCLEAAFVGFSNGLPNQELALPDAPVKASSLRLYTLGENGWRLWEMRPDFDASRRKDFHAVLDATGGRVTFGNGEKGRVPPTPCEIFATYLATGAQAGNLNAQKINALAKSDHNRALLYDPTAVPDGWTKLNSELQSISNPLPASGGAPAQTIAQAAGRADQLVERSGRAVTLADYERLAAGTPGTRVARTTAIANLHPDFPCYKAPGMITVIVVPYLPKGRPMPSPGLLQAVNAHLRPRRIIGTRIEVVGPTYRDVVVQASVQSKPASNRANLQTQIVKAINDFFDPLTGGPEKKGWPFGRSVYRSEIMKIINQVPGVDYVASLALVADCGQPQCGNVCLGPTWLVASGTHQITVL